MPKTKISEFSSTPATNTDIDSINIAEGCAPSGINDAIRELMAQLKDFQTGAVGDSFNGPVGSTTASTGAFTTLSASSTVTLSGGTANGVTYLNGSKVVTSGSALTFDGTGFQLSTSTGGNFYLNSTTTGTSNQIVSLLNNGNGYGNLNYKAFDHIWSYGASEQMRLTSTGLGIGTSSPSSKLTVASTGSTIELKQNGTGAATYYVMDNTIETGGKRWRFGYTGGAGIPCFSLFNQTDNLVSWVADASGNLGLGVTPSAWNSGYKVAEIGKVGSSVFTGTSSGNVIVTSNAYLNSSDAWTYANNGGAVYFRAANSDRSFSWHIAPSGTAGNAITFTQAMTLDASGNLGIGVTAPEQKLHIGGNNGIRFGNASSTPKADINYTSAGLEFLDIKIQGTTTGYGMIRFSTGGSATEAARIDSSGNLLVGATSAHNFGIPSIQAGGSNANAIISVRRDTTSSADQVLFYNPNGNVGGISTSGSLTSYNVTSDQRLKENIVDADSASSLIDSLQVRKFDWKTDQTHQRYGFIAQELVTVAPEAVYQPDDTEKMMAVDYSKLVPMLVKEIQSLRKRLADAGIA